MHLGVCCLPSFFEINEWRPWTWAAFPERAILYWFLGMHKVNESVFLAPWHHSASAQELFVTCYGKTPACLASVAGIWITLCDWSMTAWRNSFYYIGRSRQSSHPSPTVCVLASSPSFLLMDSKLFLVGNSGDNSNFSSSCSGDWSGPCLWYCASLIIILTFWNMRVGREEACQPHRSFITEMMLLRKVLNEGIVQMPKKKKGTMSRD